MSQGNTAPYGSWKSPITSDLIVKESIGLGQVKMGGDDIYWIELRPSEGGRQVVVRRTPEDQNIDVTPRQFNARTRVHEYGGGDYVAHNATVYFSNFADQQIYTQSSESAPRVISKDGVDSSVRYADAVVDEHRDRIVCIREDHRRQGREAVNELVALRSDGNGETKVLVSGGDFYSSPRVSPDGSRLAWLSWNHPNMPWDGGELWIGKFDDDGGIVDQGLSPAGRGNRSSNQSGLLTAFCILFLTEPVGGTFIAPVNMAQAKTFARWKQSSAYRNGYSACQHMPLNPPRKLSAHLLNGAFGGLA